MDGILTKLDKLFEGVEEKPIILLPTGCSLLRLAKVVNGKYQYADDFKGGASS